MVRQLALKFVAALLLLLGGLLWTTTVSACSVRSLDVLIAGAVATSRKYWIASILIGVVVMSLEAYLKRWSLILAATIALLVFHPHLTLLAFPKPSCEFISVQASQAVLAVLVMMLGYLIVRLLMSRRSEGRKSATRTTGYRDRST
jgi:lysylphosphatidylglycerol synthetase-like protein (DUF2156 family)